MANSALTLTRRNLLAGTAAAAVTMALAACNRSAGPTPAASSFAAGDPRSNGWRTVNQYFSSNNAFFNSWQQGSDEAARALGMTNEAQVDNSNNDKALTIFRSAATRGFNGMTSMIADPGISKMVLSTAQTNGTVVANAWNVAPWLTPFDIGDKWVQFIAPNDVAGAQAVANVLFDAMGGEGELIHITGVPGNTADLLRTEGVDRALKKFPGVKLVAREPGKFNRGATEPVISALLTAHPNVKAVFCQNDDEAMGVLAALSARGRKDVLVTGIDGIPDMLDAIASGRALATWAQHGGFAAGWLTVQVFDALAGVTLDPLERMMWLGTFVINTPEAASAYKKMMYGGAFPFDYVKMSRALHPKDWDPQNSFAPIDLETYYTLLQPKPSGYELPAKYTNAASAAAIEAVAKSYSQRVNTDPFANVRKLCKGEGGRDLTGF